LEIYKSPTKRRKAKPSENGPILEQKPLGNEKNIMTPLRG